MGMTRKGVIKPLPQKKKINKKNIIFELILMLRCNLHKLMYIKSTSLVWRDILICAKSNIRAISKSP